LNAKVEKIVVSTKKRMASVVLNMEERGKEMRKFRDTVHRE